MGLHRRLSSGVVHKKNYDVDDSIRYHIFKVKDVSKVYYRYKSVNIFSSPFDQFQTRVFLRRLWS